MKLAILFITIILQQTMIITFADDILLTTLAMVETGATSPLRSQADFKIGKAGEISRYQIHPKVWEKYANRSTKFANDPEYASKVALIIISTRIKAFRAKHNTEPETNEIYILWNAPFYLLSSYGKPVPSVIQQKAKRFANLYRANSMNNR